MEKPIEYSIQLEASSPRLNLKSLEGKALLDERAITIHPIRSEALTIPNHQILSIEEGDYRVKISLNDEARAHTVYAYFTLPNFYPIKPTPIGMINKKLFKINRKC